MVKQVWGLIFAVSFMVACGSSGEVAQGPPTIEETEVQNEQQQDGKMVFQTVSGDPRDIGKNETMDVEGDAEEIEWLDFETAIDRNKEKKKFIFIDMYTDWCGWCKKMDATTFQQSSVINYIDQNFYAVKLNPEANEAIAYKEVLYEPKQYNNKRYNELAVNLLAGKMSFPSFVILNKREVKRGVISGYQSASQLISSLKHYVE